MAVFLMASPGGDLWLALAQVGAVVANGEWWRVFTAALVHGDFTHIAFNMWALWVLGPQIERTAGTAPFIALYLAAAGAGGAFVFFLRPGIAVGASGAIFGLFGVWANMAVRGRRTWQGRAALRQIGFLLLLNAALPLMIRTIAWEAHLGGLIAGYLIGEAWSRLTGPRHNSTRTAAALAVAALSIIVVAL